jgi:predicted aspartyl protease
VHCLRGTINIIETAAVDGGEFLSDKILTSLESPRLCLLQDEGYIYLHAMSGQPQQGAIQLRALVKKQALVILVDSGSSHTFLNSSIAHKLQAPQTPIAHMTIRVANGETLACLSEVKNSSGGVRATHFQWMLWSLIWGHMT